MLRKILVAMSFLTLAANSAAADRLDSVRETLRGLPGTSPVSASLTRQFVFDKTGKAHEEGTAKIALSADAEGLRMSFPAVEMGRAEAEMQELDAEKPQSMSRTLNSIDMTEVAAALNGASSLSRELVGAKLLSESTVTYRGAPAQLLELQLILRMAKADLKHVKESSSTLKLWLAPDGTPLGSERKTAVKMRIMLVGIEANEFHSRQFERKGNRLVTVRDEKRMETAGFGEESKEKRVTEISFK